MLRDDDRERLEALPGPLGGRAFLEVALCGREAGYWPLGSVDHRAPAVVVPAGPGDVAVWWDDHREEFSRAVHDREVWVVATQTVVDRPLLGKVAVAADLFSRAYPQHGLLREAVLVDREPEPNVAWVFHRRGIRIVTS